MKKFLAVGFPVVFLFFSLLAMPVSAGFFQATDTPSITPSQTYAPYFLTTTPIINSASCLKTGELPGYWVTRTPIPQWSSACSCNYEVTATAAFAPTQLPTSTVQYTAIFPTATLAPTQTGTIVPADQKLKIWYAGNITLNWGGTAFANIWYPTNPDIISGAWRIVGVVITESGSYNSSATFGVGVGTGEEDSTTGHSVFSRSGGSSITVAYIDKYRSTANLGANVQYLPSDEQAFGTGTLWNLNLNTLGTLYISWTGSDNGNAFLRNVVPSFVGHLRGYTNTAEGLRLRFSQTNKGSKVHTVIGVVYYETGIGTYCAEVDGPTIGTPMPTAQSVEELNLLPVPFVGSQSCYTLVPEISIDVPDWLQGIFGTGFYTQGFGACLRIIQFGTLNLGVIAIDLDAVALVLGGIAIFRWLMRTAT